MARLGKGRKKVPMSKIENSNNLQVTFSKRRNGLFKKANELAVMTGAEVGIIVFSPGNRPYSFGQPDITDTINKYVGENPPPPSIAEKIAQIHRKVDVKVLNTQLNFLEDQLASALELKRKLDDETKILEKQLGIIPMKEMNKTQATMMLQALQELSLKVKNYGTANMPPKSN